ncbi:hypothetical protein HN954_01075 [bacterium]|jgi:hypothetical protein|nr:hypothetical protein [bacterium]MBT6831796.1 hypothetical protein [bacterium]MBT6996003.1 hypothetical protein [bacterium]MBT7772626.1 hypothetical protein [bacterium]
MNLPEFLAPIDRRKNWFFWFWSGISIFLIALFLLLPPTTKTTIYFSVRPIGGAEATFVNPGVEDAEKVAEMVAGWAKDPGFRDQILKKSEVLISGFKRKLSGRQQNRLNVFWTISLSGRETRHAERLADSTVKLLEENFSQFTHDSRFAFELTEPNIFHDSQKLPITWVIATIAIFSLLFAASGIYTIEIWKNRAMFLSHVRQTLPKSPILQIPKKLGEHDERLIENFLATFENPKLVSTFPLAENFFAIPPFEAINFENETPMLLVQLGETEIQELENMHAIFGDNLGIILFKK